MAYSVSCPPLTNEVHNNSSEKLASLSDFIMSPHSILQTSSVGHELNDLKLFPHSDTLKDSSSTGTESLGVHNPGPQPNELSSTTSGFKNGLNQVENPRFNVWTHGVSKNGLSPNSHMNFPSLPMITNDSQYYDSIDEEAYLLPGTRDSCRASSLEEKATTVGSSSQDTCSRSSFRMESPSSSAQAILYYEENSTIVPIKNEVSGPNIHEGPTSAVPLPTGEDSLTTFRWRGIDEKDHFDEEELSELLIGQRGSAAQSWNQQCCATKTNNPLHMHLSKEKLQGVLRIRSQLSQATQVFRELAYLINDQQDDLDLLDHSVNSIKNSTMLSLDELHTASRRKCLARRRKFIICTVAGIVALIVYVVYFGQSSNMIVSSLQSQFSESSRLPFYHVVRPQAPR